MLQFGPFTVDPARFELRRDGRPVRIERKVFDLLLYLIEHRERIVSTQELLHEIWSGTVVSVNSVRRTATLLRSALQDDPRRPRWIATLHGRGYRFIGSIQGTRGDPGAAPAAVQPRDGNLFVGRGAEQRLVDEALDRARAGESSLLLLEGEAGIGKSRFLEWCAERAPAVGVRVVASHCREEEGAPPLWPWIQVIRKLTALIERGDRDGVLRRVAPALTNVVPELGAFSEKGDLERASDPLAQRFQTYEAVLDLLHEVSGRGALLLLFDDLHRADASSLALLELLASRRDVNVTFACSMRPEGGDRAALARIARIPRSRTLSLKGLSEADVLTLLAAVAPGPESGRLAAEICRQTGGNPFFIHQVIAALPALGLGPDGSIARVLPRTVRDAIAQQCGALSSRALEALRAAAVFGREFSASVLADVLEQTEAETLDALDEARRASLLREDPEHPLHFRYVHVLVRDVLYESLGSHQRTQLHGRVGAALEEIFMDAPVRAAELAHHFSAAGTRESAERAVAYHAQAAGVAAARFDYAASIHHYRSALQLLESLPWVDPRQRSDLQAGLARQLLNAGFTEQAGDLWLRVAEDARAMADPGRSRRAALELGLIFDTNHYLFDPVRTSRAAALVEDAVHHSGASPVEQSRLLSRLALLLERDPRSAAADEVAAKALALAAELADPRAMAEALCFQHFRLRGTPDAAGRARIARQLIGHADRTDEYALQLNYRVHLAAALAELGRFDEWELCNTEYQRLAERLKSAEHTALAYRNRAMRCTMLGKFAQARVEAQRALALAAHCEPNVLLQLGQMNVAIEFETTGVSPSVVTQALAGGSVLRAVALWAQQHLECPELVREHIGPALEEIRARPRWSNWQVAATLHADSIAFIGDAERAAEVLEWLSPFASVHVLSGNGGVYIGPVVRALGVLEGTLGHWGRAVDALEEALRQVRAFAAFPWVARVHLELARAYFGRGRGGDQDRAIAHGRAGLQIAEQYGMHDMERLARRRLAACGV